MRQTVYVDDANNFDPCMNYVIVSKERLSKYLFKYSSMLKNKSTGSIQLETDLTNDMYRKIQKWYCSEMKTEANSQYAKHFKRMKLFEF